MSQDLFLVFSWWTVLLVIGLTFLPLTLTLFNIFFDRGYLLSKILGLAILSYLVWFLASIKLLPFTFISILAILILLIAVNLIILFKFKLLSQIKNYWQIFLYEELLFTAALIFWSFVKAHEPSIHNLEKFMDFGFINSILHSTYMPPKDLWLTPDTINYYYFGHFVTALLSKFSSTAPEISFNLMLATLFAVCLGVTFSLGLNFYYLKNGAEKNIKTALIVGTISAFLVTLAGNLQTIYAFFKNYVPPENPVGFWQLEPMFNFSGYWYPNATRFIPFTIHEFPIYSFVVSDLHGHVLDIPFVLLALGLFITIFYKKSVHWIYYLILGFILSIMLMTNVLDAPIYLMLSIILIFFKTTQAKKFLPSLLETLKIVFSLSVLTILFSLPFWLSFKPFGSGVGVLCAPDFLIKLGKLGPFLFEANHCGRSTLWMLTIIYGFFYIVLWGFSFTIIRKAIDKEKHLVSTDRLAFIFALFASIAILIPELVYVKDIYPAHYRANTVFKFGYQAFIAFGLTCGYMIVRFWQEKEKILISHLYSILQIIALILVSIYPYFAINSYFGGLKNYQGLNGLTYLSTLYPTDYQAILWLRETIPDQPVILEAQGDSYTDYARISANTGLPTVIGWPVHEWLWRGSYDEAGKRSGEVAQMYESNDINLTKDLLKKYNVQYVFIGTLERQKYPNLDEQKLRLLGTPIFSSGLTTIYKLNF